jgi:ribosomal protein S18 acetylase RimI-like enzyme
MQEINITKVSIADLEILQEIGKKTFFETFAESNSASDMQQYLDTSFSKEKVAGEMNNPGSQFYMAWENNIPIGYLKINTGEAQTDLKEEQSLEIERIYVLAAWHGKKVGQLLYEKALKVAEELKKSSVWLGVWEKNPRAIRFYEKNGFVAFAKHPFKLGGDEQIDILMRKILEH